MQPPLSYNLVFVHHPSVNIIYNMNRTNAYLSIARRCVIPTRISTMPPTKADQQIVCSYDDSPNKLDHLLYHYTFRTCSDLKSQPLSPNLQTPSSCANQLITCNYPVHPQCLRLPKRSDLKKIPHFSDLN